ncbi:MAG TPA: hypothetical protein VG796_21775 [Verrucomicrobiales bacterium]|nr:hypothetical protein [Verrucomicrobiales bacterium]
MKPLRTLLLLAAMLPAMGEEPRRDPFLASEAEIKALIPRDDSLTARNVNVQFDWIRMPHLTANQLIVRNLKHTREGDALYDAARELVAQKKAERLDFTTLVCRDGQRSKTESIIEKPYPTEFESPNTSPLPANFTWRNLGRTVELEATVGENPRIIDLNLAPEWVEHLGDVPWQLGLSEVKVPVFGTGKMTGQVLLASGAWQLAALLTPPQTAPEGKLMGTTLPAERVLLFTRATTRAAVKPPGPAPELDHRQITVLAEWIETDTAIASDLLTKISSVSEGIEIRAALDPMLADGRASLLESALVQVRNGQRSTVESITEYPYPTVFDPPTGANPAPAKKPPEAAAAPSPAPDTFTYRNLGTTLQAEANINDSGSVIDLNIAPELVFNAGTDTSSGGTSTRTQQRFQTLKSISQILLIPNEPALLGTFDAPLLDGKALPDASSRKLLLFVRAVL